MSKVSWKGSALLSPVPAALVTCGTKEEPNVLTIAWTGITCSNPPMTYISVRPERYSYSIIKNAGEFVINLSTDRMVRKVDLCGVKSGRDVNKFELCGLHTEEASKISAPLITECPVSLECKVKDIISLGSHDMFLAEIVAVDVDENAIDDSGKLRLEKCGLLAFSHGDYFGMGKKIGSFGFSVKKKRPKNPKIKK